MKEYVGKIKSSIAFYVGDVCYALNRNTYHDVWGDNNNYKDGKIDVGEHSFLVHGTYYGDGIYKDQHGKEYYVDAGVIGVIPNELIDFDKIDEDYDGNVERFANIVTGNEAEMWYEDGIFYVVIDGEKRYKIDTREEDVGNYYEDQLSEIYDATMTFAQEVQAMGYHEQAKKLDNVLDILDGIKF